MRGCKRHRYSVVQPPTIHTFKVLNMNSTISISTVPSAFDNALNAWQDWSDNTFDDQYREAILTLTEGLATLAGYLTGFAYCWSMLQLVKTVRYWLAEAAQAVPVLHGWWVAPFVVIEPTQYPEDCWQAIAPATFKAIFNDELSWAVAAEERLIDIS